MDGHMGVASSAALEMAGISAGSPHPEGGFIDRTEAGGLTGVLRWGGAHPPPGEGGKHGN